MKIIDNSKKIVEFSFPNYSDYLNDLKELKLSFFISKYKVKRFLIPGDREDDHIKSLYLNIDKVFMNCFDQYLSLIKVDKQFIKSNNYVATMMQDGDCFTEHSDYDGEDTDSFTLIVYLNDDYMGGELVFKDGPTLKPTAGSLIIFPSNLYHSVNIVNGDRYTIMVNMDKNDTLN